MTDETKVHWLGAPFPPEEAAARNAHLKNVLLDLKVLEGDEKVTALRTPESVQVITSGGTAMAKWWAGLTAAGAGGGALVTALRAAEWLPGDEEVESAQQLVLTASAAVLAAAAVIAVAIIVKADVSARAFAMAAEYRARATIADSLIRSFQYAPPDAPAPAAEPKHVIRTTGNKWFAVKQFTWTDAGMVAHVDGDQTVSASEIAWITPTGVWNQ